jgi:hypothetical protein
MIRAQSGGLNKMRKAGSLSQEPPQKSFAEDEQQTQTTTGPIANAVPVARATITCALCDATFVPMPEHAFAWVTDAAELEAAFMSICHFCFRCRRAACPECWDPVHRVCAQCVTWAGLPFRTEALPLANLIIPPLSSERQAHVETIAPFVCIRHGRYQNAEADEPDPETDHAQRTIVAAPRQGKELELHDDKDGRAMTLSQPAKQVVTLAAKKPTQVMKQDEDELEREPRLSIIRIVERALTISALAVLLAVIVLIVLAEMSMRANSEIARLLHVDIRSEVAYLIVMMKQIH